MKSSGRTTITVAHRLSTIKDASCIYVMGDGLVLQSGTHQQLLQDQDGPYARLVNTQKLREQEQETAVSGDSEEVTTAQVETSAASKPGASRLRSGTVTSGSNKKVVIGATSDAHQRGMIYLFGRMVLLNKEDWPKYLIGAIAATLSGLVYPGFGIVFGERLVISYILSFVDCRFSAKGISSFSDLDNHSRRIDSDRSALWYVRSYLCSYVII